MYFFKVRRYDSERVLWTMAIATELNHRVLEMKLKSFLTPALRKGRLVSTKRIQEKFKIKAKATDDRPSTVAAAG